MGTYINRKMLLNFVAYTKGLIEGEAQCVRCTNQRFKETEPYHRSLRILAKRGYLDAKKNRSHTDYYMTPKGLALYDSIVISLKPS